MARLHDATRALLPKSKQAKEEEEMAATARSTDQTMSRQIGPQRENTHLCFGFREHKITKHGSFPLKLLRSGFHHTKFSSEPEATELRFGVDVCGWPYVSVFQGREHWKLNDEPLARGRVYLDIEGRDVLVYMGGFIKREFRFACIMFSDGKGIFLACDWQIPR